MTRNWKSKDVGWSKDEVATLKALWAECDIYELSEKLKRSRKSIKQKALVLGLDTSRGRAAKSGETWQAEDEERLKSLWFAGFKISEIAEEMSRSPRAVRIKAKRMELPKMPKNPRLSECVPTTAEPGSKEKIEVLRYRMAHRQELWHPNDLYFRPPKAEGSPFFGEGIRDYGRSMFEEGVEYSTAGEVEDFEE